MFRHYPHHSRPARYQTDELIHPVAAKVDQGIYSTKTIPLKRVMNSDAFRARESASLADKEQSNGISAKSMLPIIGKLAAVSKVTCQSSLLIGGFSPHLNSYPKRAAQGFSPPSDSRHRFCTVSKARCCSVNNRISSRSVRAGQRFIRAPLNTIWITK